MVRHLSNQNNVHAQQYQWTEYREDKNMHKMSLLIDEVLGHKTSQKARQEQH